MRKRNDCIKPIAELWRKFPPDRFFKRDFIVFKRCFISAKAHTPLFNIARTGIARHNDNAVSKINFASLRIGEHTVVHNLQKYIVNILVRFFDFIEQNDRMRIFPHVVGKLPA